MAVTPGQAKPYLNIIFWSWSTRVVSKTLTSVYCLDSGSQATSSTSSSKLSTPLRDRHRVFALNCSSFDQELMKYQCKWLLAVPLHTKLAITLALSILNEKLKHVALSLSYHCRIRAEVLTIYAKTDVKISSIYSPMFCMEINVHMQCKIKLCTITFTLHELYCKWYKMLQNGELYMYMYNQH